MIVKLTRRRFAAGALGLLSLGGSPAVVPSSSLIVRVVTLAGRRVLLATPAVMPEKLRVFVLLHGLGEAHTPEVGARAWADRYGLLDADAHLRHPPVAASTSGFLPATEANRINADLAAAPFAELAYACPHMPVPVTPAYAQWLAYTFMPALRAELPAFTGDPVLGGCSLGGYASINTATAYPATFPLLACTQAAISVADAPRIATDLQTAGVRKMYFATSSADPYHDANVALGRHLGKLGADVTARSFPGPHDQPWLRDAGAIDLVHWASRTS